MNMITIFQEGDLVYSFASKEFYLMIEPIGGMMFTVYDMHGTTREIIDVTLTHVENIVFYQCEKDNKFYYNKKNK